MSAHLAYGKDSHSGPDAHLGHKLVRDYTAKYNANTANNYGDGKQPPSEVIVWKVGLVVQIAVVCEAETP
jgi:hypothetical protein